MNDASRDPDDACGDASEKTPPSAVGARIDARPEDPGETGQDPEPSPFPAREPLPYAGFLRRLGAYLVDSILLGIPTVLLLEALRLPSPDMQELMAAPLQELAILVTAVYVIQWPYFAGFEASGWQATPGKRLVSVRVTDVDGDRVSFARASARYYGKVLSEALLAIGYLMIVVTEKKQGLHDMLADCLVLQDA